MEFLPSRHVDGYPLDARSSPDLPSETVLSMVLSKRTPSISNGSPISRTREVENVGEAEFRKERIINNIEFEKIALRIFLIFSFFIRVLIYLYFHTHTTYNFNNRTL